MYVMADEFPPFFTRLHEDMSPEEVVKFAEGLRVAIKGLRDETAAENREPNIAAKAEPKDHMMKDPNANKREFPIEAELEEIEALANWCEKIGRMHFGVHLHRWF